MKFNKITNDFAIRLILKKIAESITKPLSFSRLTNILKSAGTSLGKQTVINYVGYITDSYLLFAISFKSTIKCAQSSMRIYLKRGIKFLYLQKVLSINHINLSVDNSTLIEFVYAFYLHID